MLDIWHIPISLQLVQVAYCSWSCVFYLFKTSLHISWHCWSMQDCITTREIYFWSWCSVASSCIINKKFLTSDQVSNTKFSYMIFVKAGSRLPKTSQKSNCRLLHGPPDWVLLSDLGFTLVIPSAIVISQLRPDILLYSTSTKTVIILEITCPCEGNMKWCAPKFGKFDPLFSAFVQQLK